MVVAVVSSLKLLLVVVAVVVAIVVVIADAVVVSAELSIIHETWDRACKHERFIYLFIFSVCGAAAYFPRVRRGIPFEEDKPTDADKKTAATTPEGTGKPRGAGTAGSGRGVAWASDAEEVGVVRDFTDRETDGQTDRPERDGSRFPVSFFRGREDTGVFCVCVVLFVC